jgi:hypothetical protein
VAATASSGIPTGAVTFSEDTAILGTVLLDSSGQATLTTSALSAGTHSVVASYAGDGTFNGSTSAAVIQHVTSTPQSTTVTVTVPGTAGPTGLDSATGMVVAPGITLQPGATATVTASGTISCAGPVTSSSCPSGPQGNGTVAGSGFAVPGAPKFGLIAQVGNGPLQFVGASATLTGQGSVAFGVNDDIYSDNSGSFTVTVTVSCTGAGC